MAEVASLPNELLDRIISYVRVRRDLANLRLVNRALDDLTKPLYFATVPLYAHWADNSTVRTPNDANYNAGIFKNILDDEKLRKLVKRVDIYTCNPDCVGSLFCVSSLQTTDYPEG
jgi:hypothetical protein